MKRFDVLDRSTRIHSHLMLEASAGTGKTFSIENLVVRLLIEGDQPLKIHQILLVTFTKMATSDLRARVRSNIEEAVAALEKAEWGAFDYLEPIGVDAQKRADAIRRLERALIGFDEAQIFTIHSFCYRMLAEHGMEGQTHSSPENEGNGVGQEQYRHCILDYFRTGMHRESVGIRQRKLALNSQRGSIEFLQKKLGKILATGAEIARPPSCKELFSLFKDSCERLKKVHGLVAEKVREDLELISPYMNKVVGFDPAYIALIWQILEKDEAKEEDFEQLIEHGSKLLTYLHENNKHKRKKIPPADHFHYPDLLEILNDELKLFKYKNSGLARMAYDCRKLMRRQFAEKELHNFDELLDIMRLKLKEEQFLKDVRSRYRAVIVDEFQDTDPRQWEIFKRAFPPDHSGWGHLYLVGDPKQSIYAFRQADIYTYLDAADAIGRENLYSLDTNFRSQPSLVQALNHLFSAPFGEGWMPLPRLQSYLNVPAVQWSATKTDRDFQDGRAALHWCVQQTKTYSLKKSQNEAFFPFIAQEIMRLRRTHKTPLSSFAILVADRHQAKAVDDYLKQWNIPSQRQKVEPISASPAVLAIRELLGGILHHRDESALKIALGGGFFRWNVEEILTLEEDGAYLEVLSLFRHLDEVWENQGLSACLEALFFTRRQHSDQTILEKILSDENGGQFYSDVQHVMELLLEVARTRSETLAYLEKLSFETDEHEEKLKKRSNTDQDRVQIITIHSSKGLQYDVVFALGLLNRPQKSDLYYLEEGVLTFVSDPEEKKLRDYKNELNAEKMRNLYVACTRAVNRLYLPYIETKPSDSFETASPMECFVGQFQIDFQKYLQTSSHTLLNDAVFVLETCEEEKLPPLTPPKEVVITAAAKIMTSFSSLATVAASDRTDTPHQFDCPIKSPHTLPSGSRTGTLLHRLLEEIPFTTGRQWNFSQDAISAVGALTKGSEYEEWNAALAEIVFHALCTPFVDGCALKDLHPDQCKFETEFLYLYRPESYMKGYIDLLFAHEGKFYLLDWKSNWLGNAAPDYHQEALARSMQHHDYFKQAEIYTEALKKYLNLSHHQPFQELFGGVYYIYLRGLPEYGIKFIPPSFFHP